MKILDKINGTLSNERNILIFSTLFLVMLSLPLLLLGGDVPYDCWDNLDSNVVWRKLMIDNQLIFSDSFAVIPQMMCGIPRLSLGSEWNLFTLLAKIFSPPVSLGVNRFLQIMIGFFGMFLLCRSYLIKNHNALPSAIVAILFAIIPFWSSGSLSIPMQPFVLLSFLRIRDKKQNAWDWVVIVVYPFVSLLVVYGFFFYCLLFVFFCIDWYKKKIINGYLFVALAVLSALSLLIYYREIISLFFDNDFVSHRSEMEMNAMATLIPVIGGARAMFLYGQGHALSNHYLIFWFCLLFTIYKIIKTKTVNKRVLLILLTIAGICFFSHIIWWQPIHSIIRNISIFRMFNIERFFTLLPFLWFICLACVLNEFPKKRYTAILFVLLFLVQLQYSKKHDYTFDSLCEKYIYGNKNEIVISFNDFYSEDLFNKVKENIGKPTNTYRVAALGIHPSMLIYNGFYTIDGYCPNYDIKYKHLFGELIREELNKNENIQMYFDHWGNRCYLFDDEIGKPGPLKAEKTQTTALDIRYDIMEQPLNCQYIISSVEIKNLGEHLELQQVFENNIYKIYLYKVI